MRKATPFLILGPATLTLLLVLLAPAPRLLAQETSHVIAPGGSANTSGEANGESTVSPDIAGTGSASTAPPPSRHVVWQFGPEVGMFLPTGSKTVSRFGSEWLEIGLGIGSIEAAPQHGGFEIDISDYSRYGSDSHIFVAPVGLLYRHALAGPGDYVPYAGLSADVVFADIRSPIDNVHSGFHETEGGSAILGTTLGKDAYVEARYFFNGSIDGFDLSGFNIATGYRF